MVAAQAASAAAPGLIGAEPETPVAVASASAQRPDAIVVPLTATTPGEGRPHVAGLVAFLRDCAGRAYYSAVDDLTAQSAAIHAAFPALSQGAAATRLGTDMPLLVYTDNPFAPVWRNPATGATAAAEQ
jgi:hypothetical protein